MGVFGRDFYGLTKYGENVSTEYDVNPFDANPEGYGAIRVTWHSPNGAWEGIRLLRSSTGYAVDESDGTILIDSTSSVDEFVDKGVQGGRWYYYTIFVQDSGGTWNRAGATSSLAVKKPWLRMAGGITPPPPGSPAWDVAGVDQTMTEYGHAELLWDRIPAYFRYVRRDNAAVTDEYYFAPSAALYNPDQYDIENQQLRSFLDVVGWGLDFIHNYQSTLLWANDPKRAHLSDVDRMSQEFGLSFEYGVPGAVMRSKVMNAALLARRRGTLDGLRDVASLTTGWDVDIEVGSNLMLNRDQSEFANPIFPEWDPAVNYAVGQRVQYEGSIFTAVVGAYGYDQRPPSTGTTSNTWWTQSTAVAVTDLLRTDTDGVVTWKGFQDAVTPQTLNVAIGVSDPISGIGWESNALVVQNTGTGPHTYDVVGASNLVGNTSLLPLPDMVVRQGIPVPRPILWDADTEYDLGQIVLYNGCSWRAIGTSLGAAPAADSIYWERVGVDERPVLAYSFYGHGPLVTGAAGSGGVAITPGMAFYDETGNLLLDQVVASPLTNFLFDAFNHPFGTPDFGTWGNWVTTAPWETDSLPGATSLVAYPLSGTGVATVTVPNTLTAYRVAATFIKAANDGHKESIVLRYVDANNYTRVTRTAVESRVQGVLSTLVTFATPIQDNDRVSVAVNDTTNTFTVYVNGTSVGTGSLSGGTAPYQHGMMVE